MKQILIILLMFTSIGVSAQYGGEIRAKGYAPDDSLKTIMRKDRALRTYDTLTLAQIALLRDTTLWKNSIKISELPALTATVTGSVSATVDSNTQRIGIKVLQLPTVILDSSYTRNSIKINGTLPSFAATPTFNVGTIGTIATESTLSTINGKIPSNLTVTSTRLLVDGSGVTQPVSGTFWQATQPVSLASVPSHAVTNAGTFAVQVDSSTQRNTVKVLNTVPVSGTFWQATQPVSLASVPSHAVTNAGTFAVQVDSSTQRSTIKISSMPSVTVDSATASRTTVKIITNVPIDSTTTRNTVKVLNTVPVSGTFYQATQPVSLASVPSHAVTNAGTFAVQVDSSTQRNTVKVLNTVPVSGTFYQATQPVSLASVPSHAVTLDSSTQRNTVKVLNTVPVSGTFWQATQPVSLASVPSHAVTNAGTFAVQVDSSTQRVSHKISQLPALPAGSNSIGTLGANSGVDIGDVTINNASGASAVNIQDGGNSITVDASSLPLPTGAATESTLSSMKTSLDLIDDGMGVNGAATANRGMTVLGWDGTNGRILSTNTSGHIRPDSAYERSTIKISSMPSVTVDSTTGSRITHKISESALPSGAATETTVSNIKTRMDSLLMYKRNDSTYLDNIYYGILSVDNNTISNGYYLSDLSGSGLADKKIIGSATASATINLFTGSSVVTKAFETGTVGNYYYNYFDIDLLTLGTISAGSNTVLSGSWDSSTWYPVKLWDIDSLKSDGYVFVPTNVMLKRWRIPVQYPYYKLTTGGITGGGTIRANALFYHKPYAHQMVGVDSNQFRSTINIGTMPSISVDSSTQRSTIKISSMPSTTASPTVIYDSTVTATSMTITALNSLANSATAGWKSDTIDLRARKCSDVKFGIKVTMANTAPANDKAVYVYAIPWWYDGSSWYSASGGTTTLPTGGQAAYTIASPNNFRLLGVLSYTTQNMVLQDQFLLSNAFGNVMPDMVQIFVLNYSGAAVHSSGQALYYSPTYKTQR
jgi:hypothetical protein